MVLHPTRQSPDNAGYSFTELLVVVAIIAILAGAAVMTSSTAIDAARADGTLSTVVRQLRQARELALSERRNIEVQFLAPNQVSVIRRDVVGNAEVGTTVLATVTLEGRLSFLLPPDTVDTPDGFGNAAAIDFSGATALIFTSEGTFVDQTGDPLNGTVFLSDPALPNSLRAVTIFGPTALVRAFRWNGAAWAD